uniref:Aminotransferase-like plant mobile domain-containing protein n=1 Tax=Fagus sylvatica TaxID=28930 RepID=A0A2N9GCD7_FAGSY
MFRDTEPLRQVLWRWCPTTHTFFFAWGELTLTLEDIENHWMLPILGEFAPSIIELSAEEEEIAVALRRHSSTRVTGWPALFLHHEDVLVRRVAFIVYWLCWLEDPEITIWLLLLTLRRTCCCNLTESVPLSPSLAPFLKSRAFAYWEGKVNRVMIPSGHRFSFNTASMNAYWQRLAHAMDETRSGWIVYTTHFLEGWKESVNVVEECLVMPSKRGKGGKRDVPVDSAVEKSSKKRTHSPKKASSKKTKAGKQRSSKRKSAAVPPLEGVRKQVASSKVGKKSVALRPPKDQRKLATSSSSSDEEQPSAVLSHSSPKKKKSVVPPSGASTHTRSKSASAMHKSGKPSGVVVVVKDSDTAADGISSSFSDRDDPLAATTDLGEDMRRSFEGNFEADVGSTEGSHSIASDSFSNVAPGSMNEEQMAFVGSATDPMLATLLSSGTSMAYVVEGVSLFGATPRFDSILVGGIIIPASLITGEAPLVDEFPAASEISVPEEVHTQGFVRNEFMIDLGVALEVRSNVDSSVGHGMQAEGTSSPVATTPSGGEHLDNMGEFEFLTPFFGSRMQYSLDLAMSYQMFHGLDRIM